MRTRVLASDRILNRTWMLALVVALAAALAPATTARADDFATWNEPITQAPGTILRSEPTTFHIDPLKLTEADADAHRILYVSTDREGNRIAVTGTLLEPRARWKGWGPRPLVAYAVGTQGLADRCAPSNQFAAGSEYEGAFIAGLLARGWAVVVPDYEGLGTPGLHTYLSRASQAHVVLDSIRAAKNLDDAHVAHNADVAITGYSQGGGAAAAAAELAPSYAPDLDLAGVHAGAVPADLRAVGDFIDGGLYGAFFGYALLGIGEAHDIPIEPLLNDYGRDVVADLKTKCTIGVLAARPFLNSADMLKSGESASELFDDAPFTQAIDEQTIGQGTRHPDVPVLITHSVADDVIPYRVGRDLARRWCDDGAHVQFATNVAPTHIGGAVASAATAYGFLEARLNGWWTPNSCWRL